LLQREIKRLCAVNPQKSQAAQQMKCAMRLSRNAQHDARPNFRQMRAASMTTMRRARHCEERSDEAIQSATSGQMDCFASLAMTML
jgi:hypothetical protein